MRVRLISKLELKSNFIVKPIYFEGLRKIGEPLSISHNYYRKGIDEIIVIDIVSSLYNRSINYDLIKKISKKIFVPLTVGGGIKTIDDVSKLLECGADKVALNTFALQTKPKLIRLIANKFGKQCITINIEAKKIKNDWVCLSDGGRVLSKWKVVDWIKEVQDQGAGEILIQSVDRDGSGKGYDIELLQKIKKYIHIPLIVASGAGSQNDILKMNRLIKPQAICVSTLLHENKLNILSTKKKI